MLSCTLCLGPSCGYVPPGSRGPDHHHHQQQHQQQIIINNHTKMPSCHLTCARGPQRKQLCYWGPPHTTTSSSKLFLVTLIHSLSILAACKLYLNCHLVVVL